jgi:colicin import membrane protein
VDVSVVTSSGDGAFDRSAVAAVYKASPLDLPREPGLADRFRVFNLDFRPEG